MRITDCRACGHHELPVFLDYGSTALANRFLLAADAGKPEPTHPLRLCLCTSCGLVQIDEQVAPEVLFGEYLYVSGTSELGRAHAAKLAETFTARHGFTRGDLVVEAASNDGTVLKEFSGRGARTLGVEPAANIAAMAGKNGVETMNAFFDLEAARALRQRYGAVKVFLARHVLAHVADLHGFLDGVSYLLADGGVAVVEVPYLRHLFDGLEYDTVYHEHLCYFSVGPLVRLLEKHRLHVREIEQVPIHGGSLLLTLQDVRFVSSSRAAAGKLIAAEEAAGLHRLETWKGFADRVRGNREALVAELAGWKARGKKIAGYGAPAKGMTLLSFCGIGRELVPYLVDLSAMKQSRLTPGHHIPIFSPEKLLEDQPDVTLLLAWNFAEEIVRQQSEYLRRGGRFLVPVPSPAIVGGK